MADTYQSKYTGAEIDKRLEWAEEISPHIAKQLNTETGIHGVRYWQDKLEYNDGESWVEIETGGGGGSFVVKGLYANLSALIAAHPTGEAGDAYAVGSAEDNDIYIWSIVSSAWVNIGPLRGEKGDPGEDGVDGRGIVSVTRTSGTGAPGTTDTYTITYTDSTTSTFNVYNGADGTGSGDMQSSVYDPTGKVSDAFKAVNHDYDNSMSGLLAINVQDAIDEVVASLGDMDVSAENISYDNEESELGAGNVQDAIDETVADLESHKAETAQNHVHGLSPERVRAIYVSTDDPDDEIGEDGDIWIKYS